MGANPYGVAVGDFNRDGIPDLAAANYGPDTVSVLLGTGSGGFGAATNYAVGTSPVAWRWATSTATATPTWPWRTRSANVSVLLGNGTGGFGAATNFPAGSTPPGGGGRLQRRRHPRPGRGE